MTIREKEKDEEFRKKLQNPLNPVNQTSHSKELEDYLKKLNNGELVKESKKAKEKKRSEKKGLVKDEDLFCPTCRRPTLKRAPVGFSCGFCGLHTNSPLKMVREKR